MANTPSNTPATSEPIDPGAPGWRSLVGFVAVCLTAAAFGALLTVPGVGTWYAGLHKPEWTPPSQLFGPVWTLLYMMMAVAAWLVWREHRDASRMKAINLFLAQLVLNVAWSACFFTLRSPALAMADIAVLWLAIVWTTAAFARITLGGALLMLPYLAWVTFAAALNFAIWRLN